MTTPFTHRSRKGFLVLLAFACASSLMLAAANAQITTVFYILMENRCWTNGGEDTTPAIFKGSTAAPFLNALTTPGSTAPAGSFFAAHSMSPSAQVSYCTCYHNDQANSSNTAPSIHPSEPNYVYMEAGSNLSKLDDNDPYGSTFSVEQINTFLQANPSFTGENLSGLLQNAGITWTSYTEGTGLLDESGNDYNLTRTTNGLTNRISPLGTRTVPLISFSGTASGTLAYVNEYNGTHQYNFACKHTGQLFFPATNGSTVTTANLSPTNVSVAHYEPLESLTTDLSGNTQAQYCVITPDQFNDAHTALSTAFTYTATAANNFFGTGVTYTAGSDIEQIAQVDNFCATIVPQIMASSVYQAGHAAIVIWTDETEGTNSNDMNHTLTEIIISPLCKGNAYASNLNYDHSSDINTFQKVFGVTANTPTGFLNFAAQSSNTSTAALAGVGNGHGSLGWGIGGLDGFGEALDLSDLFQSGVVPASLPGLNLTPSGYVFNRKQNIYTQTVTVTNALSTAITNPIYLVVGNLANTTLKNGAGTTVNSYPGNPYVSVSPTGLAAGASVTVTLQFAPPSGGSISDTMNAINTAGTP